MDDDPETTQLSQTGPDRPSDAATRRRRGSLAQFWSRLRTALKTSSGASLRQSLEGMLHQHDVDGQANEMAPEARSMLLNILDFGELRVDDVMVPRADIIGMEENETIGEALVIFAAANHSRLPVYRDTLDEPIGMIHIKDLLQWLVAKGRAAAGDDKAGADDDTEIETLRNGRPRLKPGSRRIALGRIVLSASISQAGLVREILFVPPSMPAADLLVKMQSTRTHMAIVVDEYGGTHGIVSFEDIVEEIVGDIPDEHEDEEPMIQKDSDGTYVADGRASIEELEDMLGVDFLPAEHDEDADTVGGLLFFMLGRVPVRGELVRHESGIEFEVLEADPRRLKTVRIHVRASSPGEEDQSTGDPVQRADTTADASDSV